MGRRKIEIQPITHERNRSVTFIKRKNGLFKKAYELGVLCSVGIAVIIFEDRPGHSPKVYQYGSSNVNGIVERHTRFDGEKEIRGPSDFSNIAGGKAHDNGDGDDDDLDDDEVEVPAVRRGKRRGSGNAAADADVDYVPSRLQLPVAGLPSSTSTTIPVSSDRNSNIRGSHPNDSYHHPDHHVSKRQRISLTTRSPSPSDDPPHSAISGSGSYTYHPPPLPNNYREQYPHHAGANAQYNPFFPVSTNTPPPSFIPLQSDFTMSSSSRVPPLPPPATRGTYTSRGIYDPALFPQMGRHQHHSQHGGGAHPDVFSAFLEADQHLRDSNAHPTHHAPSGVQHNNSSFAGIDWPDHGRPDPGPRPISSSSSSAVSNNHQPASSSGPTGWLDFLSNNSSAATPHSSTAGRGERSRSGDLFWERGGERREGSSGYGRDASERGEKGASSVGGRESPGTSGRDGGSAGTAASVIVLSPAEDRERDGDRADGAGE